MNHYPDPSRHWRSPRALARAREASLTIARAELRRRRAAGAVGRQVFGDAHDGAGHTAYFRDELLPLVRTLPAGFRVMEIGAGMGWHAAMMAAHGAGAVIATEVLWDGDTPWSPGNVSTFRRLCEREPELSRVMRFTDAGSINFPAALHFARAKAEFLPAADASLDLVYTYNCAEHIPGLRDYCAEAARVLRIGGVFHTSTEPLYYSPYGHHLWDIFPAPWAHLLWAAPEFATVALQEAGEDREWSPGVRLEPAHIHALLVEGMNYARPRDIRDALRPGPWRIEGWLDIAPQSNIELAKELGIREALRGIHDEDLLLTGLRIRLRRTPTAEGLRLPMRFPMTTRRALRRVVPRW